MDHGILTIRSSSFLSFFGPLIREEDTDLLDI